MSTTIAKRMVLHFWPFNGKVKFASPCLYWPYISLWEKCWEFIFWTSLKTMIKLSWNLMRSTGAPSKHKNKAKLNWSKIQDGRHSHYLEIRFSISLPKLLTDLSRNLLCTDRSTSGSKSAKIKLIENPRWPTEPSSWTSVFSQTTRRIRLKLTM